MGFKWMLLEKARDGAILFCLETQKAYRLNRDVIEYWDKDNLQFYPFAEFETEQLAQAYFEAMIRKAEPAKI